MSSFFQDFEPWMYARNQFAAFADTIASSMVTARCGADDGKDSCRNDEAAQQLKIVAIVTILLSGTVGVSLPLLCRKRRFLEGDGGLFAILKAFAAGVILATGFVHMLHDAEKALSNHCLPAVPWRRFPFSGFVAMLAALGTLMVDFLVTQFYERKHKEETLALKSGGATSAAAAAAVAISFNEESDNIDFSMSSGMVDCVENDQMHIVGIRAHIGSHCINSSVGPSANEAGSVHDSIHSQARHVVVSQILELGIVSHSVIIGLSLGVSQSPCTIKPLVAALSFHQFFEGFALGGCISQAQFKNFSVYMMTFFFSITTPAGIAIGACISSFYNPHSPGALIVEGILDSISAGILIYMSLVDLIAADFQSRTMSSNGRLMFLSYLALFLGAGMMSSLAIWA